MRQVLHSRLSKKCGKSGAIAVVCVLLCLPNAGAKMGGYGLVEKLSRLTDPSQTKLVEIVGRLEELRKKHGYNGPKDRYVVNPKHLIIRNDISSPLPPNAEQLSSASTSRTNSTSFSARLDGRWSRIRGVQSVVTKPRLL